MANPLHHMRAQRPLAALFLALVMLGVVAALVRSFRASDAVAQAPYPAGGPLPGELTDRAPWPANSGGDLLGRLAALGLPALAREGAVLHIHAHLDVFVNGRRVAVPAGIGIDAGGRFISPLHTHDTTGVIHVESPTVRTFTLGQFFGVWGVRFGGGCLGGYCGGHGRLLRVYADGRPVAGPDRLALAAHQEIVVAFGTRRQLPRPVPARYAFPTGL